MELGATPKLVSVETTDNAIITRLAATTDPQLINDGRPVLLMGIFPDAALLGEIVFRDGAIRMFKLAGIDATGVHYGGLRFDSLSIALSNAADACVVTWKAR